MSSFKVRLFGEFSATDHRGNTLALGNRRTDATIAWLALHLDAPTPLRDFAALFGSVDDPSLGRDLRYALRFAAPDVLIGSGDTLRLNPRSVEVDVVRFELLAGNESLNAVRAASEIYRGDLLDRFDSGVADFDDWLSERRLHYWSMALAVLGKLLAAQIKAGWWEDATDTASRILALDPTQEVVHRALMRLQLEQGRPDSALRRYQECADILDRQFDRLPSAETERLRDEILAALERTPAPRDTFHKALDGPVLILLLEDDAVSSALVEGFLIEAGYEVVVSADGGDALLELGRREFDLIVLDVNVPTLNGLRLFEIMMSKGMETPAIFITGVAGAEVEARSLELGAAAFLRKPIRKETLLPRVRAILQRRERVQSSR
ncbi:MAG TPA: response regulator [Thermoanaerobaculia bacterium]|jgi:CheY-like chemotaxis protein|nr:response regulator [Thermoanaerobaculia bacterium]